jgi:hypothetical protein
MGKEKNTHDSGKENPDKRRTVVISRDLEGDVLISPETRTAVNEVFSEDPIMNYLKSFNEFYSIKLPNECAYFTELLTEAKKPKRQNMIHRRDYCRTPDGKIYIYFEEDDEYWLVTKDGRISEDETTTVKKIPDGTLYAHENISADWAWTRANGTGDTVNLIMDVLADLEALDTVMETAIDNTGSTYARIKTRQSRSGPLPEIKEADRANLPAFLEHLKRNSLAARKYFEDLVGFKCKDTTKNYFAYLLLDLEKQLFDLIHGVSQEEQSEEE